MSDADSHLDQRTGDIFSFPVETTAPPIFRKEELEEMLAEARDNAARKTGPMQHLALIGDRGSGKTFLTLAFATTLGTTKFRGKVVILPEYQPQVQKPESFIAEVYRQVTDSEPRINESWEAITAKLDKLFTAKSRTKRLLVVIAENFPETLKRTFPSHSDQTKLRNWLDRPESRVMLVTSASTSDLDGEPGEPLFGIFHTVDLQPISADTAGELIYWNETQASDQLFQFLFRQSDRTPKSANILALSYSRYGKDDWQSIIVDFMRYSARTYELIIEELGHRAAICMHDMIVNGEPVSQSGLVKRLGSGQQSAVAQPFAEMRRKHLLYEQAAPNSRAKLASFKDRFFVSFYRDRVLAEKQHSDLLFLLAEILAFPIPNDIDEMVEDVINSAREGTRAEAFKTFIDLSWDSAHGPLDTRAFAVALISRFSSPPVLSDIAEGLTERDLLAGFIVSSFADCLRKDDAENRWASCQPDVRTLVQSIGRELPFAED